MEWGWSMAPKTGRILPKTGRTFPNASGAKPPRSPYIEAIAAALRTELGDTRHTVKIAMRWTGAGERTVRNWFSGTSGPSGEHLVALAGHSDCVWKAVLTLVDRDDAFVAGDLITVREQLAEMLKYVDLKIAGIIANRKSDCDGKKT